MSLHYLSRGSFSISMTDFANSSFSEAVSMLWVDPGIPSLVPYDVVLDMFFSHGYLYWRRICGTFGSFLGFGTIIVELVFFDPL
jgi:hypothetical protein